MERKAAGTRIRQLGSIGSTSSSAQSMRRDTWFQKSTIVAEAYDPYSVDDDYEDEEEEVAAAEWN